MLLYSAEYNCFTRHAFMKQFAVIFILSTLAFLPGYSNCNCSDRSFVQQSDWADEIFIGSLIQKESAHEEYAQVLDTVNYFVFEVSKKWKGGPEKYITIIETHSTCDMPFDLLGEEYIIYAYRDNYNTFTTSRCTRSINTNSFTENNYDDRKLLDARFGPPVEFPKDKSRNMKWDSYLILSIIIIAAFIYWGKIRKSAPK